MPNIIFYQTPWWSPWEDFTLFNAHDLTLQVVPCAMGSLKASSLNDIGPKLHELCRSDPHLFETVQRHHDECMYPHKEILIRKSCDLDGTASGSQLFQLFHNSSSSGKRVVSPDSIISAKIFFWMSMLCFIMLLATIFGSSGLWVPSWWGVKRILGTWCSQSPMLKTFPSGSWYFLKTSSDLLYSSFSGSKAT